VDGGDRHDGGGHLQLEGPGIQLPHPAELIRILLDVHARDEVLVTGEHRGDHQSV